MRGEHEDNDDMDDSDDDRCCELSVFMAGGAVGFYCGNIKFAENDMKALKPTILPAVPKFLNKIYDACVTSVNKVRCAADLLESMTLCLSRLF